MYVVGSIDAYDTVLEEFEVEGFGDTFVCRPDIKSYDCESLVSALTALVGKSFAYHP